MAEEILVKEALTDEMKRAGAELTRKLDEAHWPVVASFWYFVPTENQWKLMLASPEVESKGPGQAYGAIVRALRTLQDDFPGISLITAVAPSNRVVQALSGAIRTGFTIDGIPFSQRVVNGHFVEDAYVYRLAPENAAA